MNHLQEIGMDDKRLEILLVTAREALAKQYNCKPDMVQLYTAFLNLNQRYNLTHFKILIQSRNRYLSCKFSFLKESCKICFSSRYINEQLYF